MVDGGSHWWHPEVGPGFTEGTVTLVSRVIQDSGEPYWHYWSKEGGDGLIPESDLTGRGHQIEEVSGDEVAAGVTMNEGVPMRLLNPFIRIAVCDGAIYLWSDDGALLMVPSNAGAYLSGIIAKNEAHNEAGR